MAYRQATPAAQPVDRELDPAFTTPEQLEQQRAMSQLLLAQSQQPLPVGRSGSFEAVSPWGGLAQMAKALMGGLGAGQITRDQLAQAGIDQRNYQHTQPLSPDGAAQPNPNQAVGSPSHAQGPTAQAPAELKQLFAAKEQQYNLPPGYLEGTARIESSFNPRNLNELSGAHGLFQFIKGTAHQYGLKYGGTGPGSTGDPVASTDAAARFAADNMKHLQSHGINPDAGNLYLAHQQGPAGAAALLTHPNAPAGSVVKPKAISANAGDPRAPAAQFAAHWASKFPQGQGQQDFISQFPTGAAPQAGAQPQATPQAAAAGQPQLAPIKVASTAPMAPGAPAPTAAPGSPQAAAAALAGQPAAQAGGGEPAVQMAGGPPVPAQGMTTPQPSVTRGGQVAPPGMVPGRVHMPPEKLGAILRNPNIPQPLKDRAMEQSDQEFQPIAGVGAYGIPFVNYPGKTPWGGPPNQTINIAPPPETVERKTEGLEHKEKLFTQPQGAPPPPEVHRVNPEALGGTSGPAAAPTGDSPLDRVSPNPPSEDKGAVGKGSALERPGGLKVAEADLGNRTDAANPLVRPINAPSMLDKGAKPPPAVPANIPQAPGTQKGPQVAQSGGSISPEDKADLDYLKKYNVEKAGQSAGATEAYKNAEEFRKTIITNGDQAAKDTRSKLSILRDIVNSPEYQSGAFSDVTLLKRRLADGLVNAGIITGSGTQAKSMEMADKMIADLNLDTLHSRLGGWAGQVKVFEGQQVAKAFANPANSKAANQALVEYAIALNERAIDAANQVNQYARAHGGLVDPTLEGRLFNYYNERDAKGNLVRPLLSEARQAELLKGITTKPSKAPDAMGAKVPTATPLNDLLQERQRRQQEKTRKEIPL